MSNSRLFLPKEGRGVRTSIITARLRTSIVLAAAVGAVIVPGAVAATRSARVSGAHGLPLKGTSRQGLAVSLSRVHFLPAVHADGRGFRFKARLTCSDGVVFTGGLYIVDLVPTRGGKLDRSVMFHSNGWPTTAAVRGRIHAKSASGTLSVSQTQYASSVPTGIHCHSGRVHWRAA